MLCLLRREPNYSLWARWQYQEGEGQDASFVHVWLMEAVKPNTVSWHRLCQNCACILAFIKGVSSSNCCVQSSPLQRRDRCKDVRSRTARTFRSAPCCQDTANNCNVGIKMKVFFFFFCWRNGGIGNLQNLSRECFCSYSMNVSLMYFTSHWELIVCRFKAWGDS